MHLGEQQRGVAIIQARNQGVIPSNPPNEREAQPPMTLADFSNFGIFQLSKVLLSLTGSQHSMRHVAAVPRLRAQNVFQVSRFCMRRSANARPANKR